MRYLPDRYKVWNKILVKHEKRFEEEGTGNLHALYSNQKQVDNELRKGRMTPEEHEDLTNRYLRLKEKLENAME